MKNRTCYLTLMLVLLSTPFSGLAQISWGTEQARIRHYHRYLSRRRRILNSMRRGRISRRKGRRLIRRLDRRVVSRNRWNAPAREPDAGTTEINPDHYRKPGLRRRPQPRRRLQPRRDFQDSPPSGDGGQIIAIARRYLGVPYAWGGTTPRGFDCSGYVQYVYRKAGHSIPRSAGAQYRALQHISRPRPGDLVFFSTYTAGISHVGIYAGNGRFIHSPRSGKVVSYAKMGDSYWRRRYRGARRVF